MTIKERLEALRVLMKKNNTDAYLVPTDDFHCSEYVGSFFKCREYITGFTGSAGTALILGDMAGLWTDGRYFLQAEQQLQGSGIELFRMGEPGVPTVEEFLEQQMKAGQCLGFDGRTMSAEKADNLRKKMERQGVSVRADEDLIGEIWTGRPALSCEPTAELDICWTGKSRKEKCGEIREAMEKKGADIFILTSLEDIAWLLNIRGGDIHCCPVVLSYLIVTRERIILFADKRAFSVQLEKKLGEDGIELLPYEQVYEAVRHIPENRTVLVDREQANYRLVSNIPVGAAVLDRQNLTLLPKAVKNPTEVENTKKAHIRDGVAVTKFIYWLKKNVGSQTITELSAAEHLFELRSRQEHFMGNSFDPIIAYGPHASIIHYSATEETDIALEPKGLLLADTGGHYLEGTTDITRTIVLGELTYEQKKYFTAVLRGMLALADARFHYGCTGVNLDYLARQPLWELGQDYRHGTGHGVGYYLSVHEMPNSFRWKPGNGHSGAAVFEEGMITSDEPGYYLDGEYGIRHENLLVCKKAEITEYGQFMCFEHLTMVPFDLEGILPEELGSRGRCLLNQYHARVYENISPYLDQEEKEWLFGVTREI